MALSDERKLLFSLLGYVFVLQLFCTAMSPLYPINDWADVNLYFNVGKAMFNGQTLYTETFDHKGPLIFVIYGLGYLISNASFFGLYIIQSLLWFTMAVAAFYTARLFLVRVNAFAVALLFPVFMLTHTGQGGSAEEFIAIFQCISLFVFIRYFKDKEGGQHRPVDMLLHGIMFALTLFTKINLAIFWFFPLLGLFAYLLYKKENKNILQNTGAFICGVAVVALPISLYLLVNGALSEAWDIYIVLNRQYANVGSPMEIAERIATSFYLRLRFDTFPFLLILTGAIYFPVKYIQNTFGRIALILSFFALYCAIFVTPSFIYYYSIPYYIYGLTGFIVLARFVKVEDKRRFYIIFAAVALIWGIGQKNFFGYQINELLGRNKKESILTRYTKIVGQEKDPTLLNLNLDSFNSIFTGLNIVPHLKYSMSPNLAYDIYPDMRDEQTRYIEEKQAHFIILSEGGYNFDYFFNLPALSRNYTIRQQEMNEGGRTMYLYERKN
ncbi:glycosyltransferase family 39 protein [Dysgonomonas sp. 511]|uniref:ArnT family glycosyltransferase n=1 Tax=Dysgonomonas sp. 511 TaxID=2302930 RepID=UPI0013D0B960|nr:glycosyltransferase family 39 protein [Dysgonomonas sp. 511]NDV80168.1 hypothetical protein [Dysgonomonas sp. 511]